MLFVLASSMVPVIFVYANVPTVLSLEIETRGEATFLLLEVSHSNPTSTHFVSTAEIEVGDETVIHLDLISQTENTFTIEVELESKADRVRARFSCTTHGWSSWRAFSADSNGRGGGIPGFSIGTVTAGIFAVGLLLWRARQRARHALFSNR